MNKTEARKEIKKSLKEVQALLDKVTSLAEEHEIEVEFKPSTLGTYEPRHIIWEASSGCAWETSDEWAEGRWSHENFDWYSSTC